MEPAETELEELLIALESLERKMTLMQCRVARLKRETRKIGTPSTTAQQPAPAADPTAADKARLRASADRLQRFATPQPGSKRPKRTLH